MFTSIQGDYNFKISDICQTIGHDRPSAKILTKLEMANHDQFRERSAIYVTDQRNLKMNSSRKMIPISV